VAAGGPGRGFAIERHGYFQHRSRKQGLEDPVTVAGIISAILVGLVVGALGRLVVPGRQNIPVWLTIVVGIIAAFIGTAIAKAVGVSATAGFDWIEFFIQIGVAALGVLLVSGLGGGRRTLSHR
jgi:uncharacterized membrane protein YeaQ/YmgE (transglycosylase-associated protein family)